MAMRMTLVINGANDGDVIGDNAGGDNDDGSSEFSE